MKNHAPAHLGLTSPSSARLGHLFSSIFHRFRHRPHRFSQLVPSNSSRRLQAKTKKSRALRPGGPPQKTVSAIDQSHILRPDGLRRSIIPGTVAGLRGCATGSAAPCWCWAFQISFPALPCLAGLSGLVQLGTAAQSRRHAPHPGS